jgi:hypothetical protein
MAVANGVHGEVRFGGRKIAKVTSASFDTTREILDTTGIGEMDDEFAYGKRNTSGSATLLYKTDDESTRALMNRIFDDNESPDNLELILYKGGNRAVSGSALISSLGLGMSVNENTSVNVAFVFSGKPSRLI